MEQNSKNYEKGTSKIINYKSISANSEIMDYQGICWLEITNKTRSQYRYLRNIQFQPYLSDIDFNKLSRHPSKLKLSKNSLYEFQNFYRNLSPTIGHFQLRYNLAVTSYHDLYYISGNDVLHYCTLRNKKRIFPLNNAMHPVCLSVLDNFLCVGDLYGKLFLLDIKTNNRLFSGNFLTNEESHIINSVKLCRDNRIITASNDCKIRILDFNNILTPVFQIERSNPVNYAIFSPNNQLLGSYSDQKEAEIFDPKTGKLAFLLEGHQDFGFCLDFHPNGLQIATGNQDATCRIWDLRNPKKSLHILQSELASVYSTKYSQDGRFLAFGETIDFVNVYDCREDYGVFQQIDFFGEMVGLDFNPEDSKNLFVAINIRDFDGIFEFKIKREINLYESLKNSFL